MDQYFVHHLCSHVTVACYCPVNYRNFTSPSTKNKLEILLRCHHFKIQDGTTLWVSDQLNMGMDVVKDFKSYDVVKDAVARLLSEYQAPPCCFDYITDCVFRCAHEVPETTGPFHIIARVTIIVTEKLDVEEEADLIDDAVTESMEEDNGRRFRASKSFIGGLKKEEYRYNSGDSKSSRSVNTNCVVCMEGILDGSEVSNMPCSHMFHSGCLITWLHESNSCPVCRFQVDPAD